MVAVSHSASQKVYIDTQAKKRGLKNVTVITSDINDFEAPVAEDQGGKFDRIISIEMIEHTKNWEKLFGKISSWLKPEGLFFMHIFTHKEFPFHYVDGWMAKTFFTGASFLFLQLRAIPAVRLALVPLRHSLASFYDCRRPDAF
jgi:cyclopropane-fatty-acyl-phospholipid synthase